MSPIHPHLQNLLTALAEGPMGSLAVHALARIQSIEDGEDPFDKRSFIPPDEKGRQRGLRQLSLADEAIQDLLEGELTLTAQLGALAGRFGVTHIEVVPIQDPNKTIEGRSDHLLAAGRRDGIKNFLLAWKVAVGATRQVIETDSDA